MVSQRFLLKHPEVHLNGDDNYRKNGSNKVNNTLFRGSVEYFTYPQQYGSEIRNFSDRWWYITDLSFIKLKKKKTQLKSLHISKSTVTSSIFLSKSHRVFRMLQICLTVNASHYSYNKAALWQWWLLQVDSNVHSCSAIYDSVFHFFWMSDHTSKVYDLYNIFKIHSSSQINIYIYIYVYS